MVTTSLNIEMQHFCLPLYLCLSTTSKMPCVLLIHLKFCSANVYITVSKHVSFAKIFHLLHNSQMSQVNRQTSICMLQASISIQHIAAVENHNFSTINLFRSRFQSLPEPINYMATDDMSRHWFGIGGLVCVTA